MLLYHTCPPPRKAAGGYSRHSRRLFSGGAARRINRFSQGKQIRQPRICSPAGYFSPQIRHLSSGTVPPPFTHFSVPRPRKKYAFLEKFSVLTKKIPPKPKPGRGSVRRQLFYSLPRLSEKNTSKMSVTPS